MSSDGMWFCGNHGPEGVFGSLKGPMLAPHIQQPMTSSAMGDTRHIASAGGIAPASTINVNTGTTGPGGTLAGR
ncbi:MAG TPA: hypothetical protein VIY48_18380 [Candidatus Paceibacterota bacterium]